MVNVFRHCTDTDAARCLSKPYLVVQALGGGLEVTVLSDILDARQREDLVVVGPCGVGQQHCVHWVVPGQKLSTNLQAKVGYW